MSTALRTLRPQRGVLKGTEAAAAIWGCALLTATLMFHVSEHCPAARLGTAAPPSTQCCVKSLGGNFSGKKKKNKKPNTTLFLGLPIFKALEKKNAAVQHFLFFPQYENFSLQSEK